MAIAGTGIDIIEVSRIAQVIERHGDRFFRRVFTSTEIDYCRQTGVPAQHYAGRFAVKEAVLKALGTGWIGRIRWSDVEVRNAPSGAPNVELHGAVAQRCKELGVTRIHISLSHSGGHAVAHAVAEAE